MKLRPHLAIHSDISVTNEHEFFNYIFQMSLYIENCERVIKSVNQLFQADSKLWQIYKQCKFYNVLQDTTAKTY